MHKRRGGVVDSPLCKQHKGQFHHLQQWRDGEAAKDNQDTIDTESTGRRYEDKEKQSVERMVDNQGWFGGNKKRFFPYSKRDEKQVMNPDFCQGGI